MRRSHVRSVAVPFAALAIVALLATAEAAHAARYSDRDEPTFRNAGTFVVSATNGGGLGSLALEDPSSGAASTALTPFLYFGHDSADQTGSGTVTDPTISQSASHFAFAPGADYFVIDGVSLGGEFAYANSDVSSTASSTLGPLTNSTTVDTSTSSFGFAPRVGFDFSFSQSVSLWIRGGFGYVHSSTTTAGSTQSSAASRFGVGLDAQILWHAHPNFFIGVGPGVSRDLSASTTVDDGNGTTTTKDAAKVTRWRVLTFTIGGVL
ncbi:MAG: hypothetical protein ACHREM_25000 [Polyangiales bacterium]